MQFNPETSSFSIVHETAREVIVDGATNCLEYKLACRALRRNAILPVRNSDNKDVIVRVLGDGKYRVIQYGKEIACVEKIAGMDVQPVDYSNIPGATYTSPEIASVGLTEKKVKEMGIEYKVGKFPFTASGKATTAGEKDGFVKLIIDANTDKILGAHLIGANVTEMLSGIVLARNVGATAKDIIKTIHPHPTMSEAIMEAAAAAHGEVIHM